MEVIIKVIDNKSRIYEGTLMLNKVKRSGKKVRPLTFSNKKNKAVKPSDIIREMLYQRNFFKAPKTLHQVEKKLNALGFNFKKGSILMSLKGANYLRKDGEKGSYKFVQIYPA